MTRNPGLPVRKLPSDPNAHVIMCDALRDHLARKEAQQRKVG